jgi:hypothetical protein
MWRIAYGEGFFAAVPAQNDVAVSEYRGPQFAERPREHNVIQRAIRVEEMAEVWRKPLDW